MRRGILQLLLAALVLLQAVASEKASNKTAEATEEKDILKEETGHVSFHVRPQGNYGSRSSSQSKSSSKSHGSGSGKGYGYGSNGPQDKGPQGGYRAPPESSYGHSYEDHSKGSGESYKGSGEVGGYQGEQHYQHRDASPEYSASHEDHYDNRGRYGPRQSSEESYSKSYPGEQRQNRGYAPSSGTYAKDSDLPSVSPDGYIESHSSQKESENKARPQELGPHGYDGPKESYDGQSYQGYQRGHGGQSSQSYQGGHGGFLGRDLNAGYGGPTSYGGFIPVTNVGQGSPKLEPYTNLVEGKEIDGNKLSLFIKELGPLPVSPIQEKNTYDSNHGKLGAGKEQRGYLLFPVVPKGQDGNSQAGGYGAFNDAKNTFGILKDAGYTGPVFTSQQLGSNHGRDYVGGGEVYGLGGQHVGNAPYQQPKDAYAQSHGVVSDGKNAYGSPAGAYSSEGSYPKQQGGAYGGDGRYETSAVGGPDKASYGPSGRDRESYGRYESNGKYSSPSAEGKTVQYSGQNGPADGGHGYAVTGNGAAGGEYSGKEYPRQYRGVVNFARNQNNGYNGGSTHAVPLEVQGKSNANYESAGPEVSNAGYSLGNADQNSGKNYPLVGFLGGGYGTSRSPAGGYGDIGPKGIGQPSAPKDKKGKSVAIILQRQPLNVPALSPVEGYGPELDAQFKAPFKGYLGGEGFDFNLGNYGSGITDFGGFKGRDTASDLFHGLENYGADLTPVNYGNNNAKFY